MGANGNTKQPYCFEVNEGKLFAFAGIWDRWKDPSGGWIKTCSILTTTPNTVTSAIHDRMPVILDPDGYDLWLDPGMKNVDAASELLKPYDARRMRCYPVTSIDFGDDVDNLRYDAAAKRLYVGYGDEKTGAIGIVDAATNKRLDDEFKLGAHPESFQLSASGPNICVNLPDLKQIAVINRSTHSIVRWPLTFESNFPMALDEADHRLFVATRVPPRLAVFDTNSGHLIATLPTVQDSDDLYYDAARNCVYVCGGEGYISVFQQEDAITTSFSPKFRPP